MANTIRLKRRASGGASGAPSALKTTEPAFNEADNVLYLGFGDDGSGNATSIVSVGGKGAFVDLSTTQTIGGAKTFSSAPAHPTPTSTDNSTTSATTAFVKAQGYITSNQSITLSGDASGTGTTAISVTLANSGVTAGTYTRVTVDAKGRVTAATNPTTLSGYGITDAQPLDADLTAIAALAGTSGLLKKTAADTWSLDTSTYLTGNQSITLSGDITGSGTTAITGTLATVNSNVGTYTKVTVNGKGLVTAATNLLASDIPTLTASKISDFDTQVRTSRLDQMAAPTASVSMNSQKITSLLDPTNAQDAATKNYVDSVAQGLDVKLSVKCATTANITLSGLQTIDGITVVANDRVLVKNQSTASANGVYLASASAWTRATDMDAWTEVPNAFTFVEEGTTLGDTGWVCTANAGGTLGSTSITWAQFSGAGTYLAGNGLSLTGSTFAAVGTANRIAVSGSGIDIDAAYVGQSSITTLGTIATGTWSATTIAVNKGGTGVTTLTGLVKGNGTSAFSAAVAGTDYLDPSSTIDGGTF